MIDFANVKNIVIPEGEVAVIARGDEVLWQKQTKKYKTELAYLESTGTQWIDTLVKAGSFMPSVKIKFRSTHYNVGYFGVHNNGSRQLYISKANAETVRTLDYGRTTTDITVLSGTEWNEVFVDRQNKQLTADGNTVPLNGTFYWAEANPTNLALFGVKKYSVGDVICSKVAVSYCQMFDNELNLIADFIPVLDWDNVPCMYDRVTEQFFYNQGTGTFLYGELEE